MICRRAPVRRDAILRGGDAADVNAGRKPHSCPRVGGRADITQRTRRRLSSAPKASPPRGEEGGDREPIDGAVAQQRRVGGRPHAGEAPTGRRGCRSSPQSRRTRGNRNRNSASFPRTEEPLRIRELGVSVQRLALPQREVRLPDRETTLPAQELPAPKGEAALARGKPRSPTRATALPAQEKTFPVSETKLRSRKMPVSNAKPRFSSIVVKKICLCR